VPKEEDKENIDSKKEQKVNKGEENSKFKVHFGTSKDLREGNPRKLSNRVRTTK
jgi:hypothetical protein